MKEKIFRYGKYALYPLFYLFCLALFGYLTFPFYRLNDRVVAEIEQRGKPGQRVSIGRITSYWFTGLDLQEVKLTLPPSTDAMPASPFGPTPAESSAASKETTIAIDDVHVRAKFWPLLIGRVRLDFGASLFNGTIDGTVPAGGAGDVSVNWDKIDIGKIDPLSQLIGGLPIKGLASGSLELSAVEGKFSNANGTLSASITGITIGDGKTKALGMVELPPARAGDLTIDGEAKAGVIKINKLQTTGPDVEVVGDGRITVREPWDESTVDIYLRFRFSDAYRTKSDATKSLLGDPNSSIPPILEVQDPRMKRSKRPDGFYGWHIHGPLKKLKYDPASSDAAAGRKPGAKEPFPTPPAFGGKRPFGPSGVSMPLGTSTAKDNTSSPPPPPPGVITPPATRTDPPPTPDPVQTPPRPSPFGVTPQLIGTPVQQQPPQQAPPQTPPETPPPPEQQPADNGGGE